MLALMVRPVSTSPHSPHHTACILIPAHASPPCLHRAAAGLLLFSAAAPLAAVATFYTLSSVSWLTAPQGVALCLLASGGSVLHAGAVHVLPGVPNRLGSVALAAVAAMVPILINALVDEV